MKEYRLAKGWQIATYLLSPAFIALGIFVVSLSEGNAPLLQNIILIISGIGIVLLFGYAVLDARGARFVINEDHIYYRSLFTFRKLQLEEIKAYSVDENYIHVIPTGNQKKVKVSRYYGKSREIIEWLGERFPYADDIRLSEELNEILTNDELGITEESREVRYKTAKKVANFLNGVAWVITLWIWFYPRPYNFILGLNIFFPFVALYFCYSFRGIFKADEIKGSAYPSIGIAFLLPGVGILLRALLDVTILDYTPAWPFIALITLSLAGLYLLPTGGLAPKKMADYISLLVFPIMTFCYSFGTYALINCKADKSPATTYQVKVIGKLISSGKQTTYELELAPWGDRTESKQVKVTKDAFNRVTENGLVLVKQRPGFLRLPWIDVEVP